MRLHCLLDTGTDRCGPLDAKHRSVHRVALNQFSQVALSSGILGQIEQIIQHTFYRACPQRRTYCGQSLQTGLIRITGKQALNLLPVGKQRVDQQQILNTLHNRASSLKS